MSQLIQHVLLFLALSVIVFSCKKEDDEEFPPEPNITFVSISTTKVKNFKNELEIVINYKDNNGDLGYSNPDIYSLQVQDSRLDSADWYHVPPLAPEGNNIVIEGQLKVKISNLFILGNGDSEIVDFSIKIRDREGHWSNVVVTPTVSIEK